MGGRVGVSACDNRASFCRSQSSFAMVTALVLGAAPSRSLTQLSFPLYSWEDMAGGAAAVPQPRLLREGSETPWVLLRPADRCPPKPRPPPFDPLCCYFSFPWEISTIDINTNFPFFKVSRMFFLDSVENGALWSTCEWQCNTAHRINPICFSLWMMTRWLERK